MFPWSWSRRGRWQDPGGDGRGRQLAVLGGARVNRGEAFGHQERRLAHGSPLSERLALEFADPLVGALLGDDVQWRAPASGSAAGRLEPVWDRYSYRYVNGAWGPSNTLLLSGEERSPRPEESRLPSRGISPGGVPVEVARSDFHGAWMEWRT